MLRFALSYDGPVAIRYQEGARSMRTGNSARRSYTAKSEMLYEEKDIAILSVGPHV